MLHGKAEVVPCLTGRVILDQRATWTPLPVEALPILVRGVAFRLGLVQPRIAASSADRVVVRSRLDSLLTALHSPPLGGLLLMSWTLAILMGPVNYWWVRRRGVPVLFFLTTPLLALGGMVVLGAYALAGQGLGTHIREHALLLHDLTSGQGMVYLARAVRAGKAPPMPPTFSLDTAIVPFSSPSVGVLPARAVTNWTGGQRLEEGYITAREPRGLVTLSPVPVRMAVRVTVDARGRLVVDNGLPHRVREVVVRVQGLRGLPIEASTPYYGATEVPSGGRRVLAPWKAKYAPWSLFVSLDRLDWQVFAECDGLPLLPDGGVTGEVDHGVYNYIAAWSSPLPGSRPAEGAQEGGAP